MFHFQVNSASQRKGRSVVTRSASRSCACRVGRATHGLSTVVDMGVPWVSCRAPPVCHDVQGDDRAPTLCVRGACVVVSLYAS